jgi:hypothetical protein
LLVGLVNDGFVPVRAANFDECRVRLRWDRGSPLCEVPTTRGLIFIAAADPKPK